MKNEPIQTAIRSLAILAISAVFLTFGDRAPVSASGPGTSSIENPPIEERLINTGTFKTLAEAIAASRYSFRFSGQGLGEKGTKDATAPNPANSFKGLFTDNGVLLRPLSESEDWELRVDFKGVGREENIESVERGARKGVKGNKAITIDYSTPKGTSVMEWFVNSPDGLEQGWTVTRRPGGDSGELTIQLETGGTLAPEASGDGRSVLFRSKDSETKILYDRLKSWDAHGRPLKTTIRAEGNSIRISVDDTEAIYPVTVDPFFSEVRKLTPSDGVADDWFGWSVAISGDTAVVGTNPARATPGTVYVYERNSTGANLWGEVALLTQSDGAAFDVHGFSVSISGDTVVAGAPGDADAGAGTGSAYVFERNFGGIDNWGEVAKLTASDAVGGDGFGNSVSISNDSVIVGAPFKAGGGAAYVFGRNVGSADGWGEVTKITASDAAGSDAFGFSVSLDVDTAVVGAPDDDDDGSSSGAAYVFERNSDGAGGTAADNWGEVAKVTASDAAADDVFGEAVSIRKDKFIVGATGDDDVASGSGSAYIFSRNTGGADSWGEVKKLTAADPAADDAFGFSVSIDGENAAVGSVADDDEGTDSGSAYFFDQNRGGADNWGQGQKITASDGTANGTFGVSVALDKEFAIVGAFDVSGATTGAAYVFFDQQDTWFEVLKKAGSDGASGDQFGLSVSLSGDTAIVGAPFDDDSGNSSGAAYIFAKNQGGTADSWGEVTKLTAFDGALNDQFGISVSISGDTAIVGSPNDDDVPSESGSAYIYSRNQGGSDVWGLVTKITASDAANDDGFGDAVAIGGDTAIVGALRDDDDGAESGSAYIFERNSGGVDQWGEVTKITSSDAASGDRFGDSVAISGDRAIVGTSLDDDAGNSSGAAYIFSRNQGGVSDSWGETAKLTASDAAADDEFGFSVAIEGDIAVVGARFDDDVPTESGSAYVFYRNQGGADGWGEVKKLTASDAASGDEFGFSVSISGETAAVGARFNDEAGSQSGAVYLFTRNSDGAGGILADNWGEVDKRTASDSSNNYEYGGSISLSGDTLLVGARFGNNFGALSGQLRQEKDGKVHSLGGVDSGAVYVSKLIVGPTAAGAEVAGKVSDGIRGLPNVIVVLTESDGTVRVSRTNAFGEFRFKDIESGQLVLMTAKSKSHSFQPQLVEVNSDLKGLELIGQSR
ncbi:MAG: hypothetical protein DWQ47_12555 [Acidobacteria bacterium]|nr:MAG: hypothetical protein DWQ32_14970 [Acidobacteriota bacterium]REJ98398.1 MAG: hypothetical protein DWQ38_17770 [Acidobacteriota bacterium]REK17142.1 MAG: hypothetical protein DWQ43_02815 [Acidobacteriota bacterium]REK43052.1 MAG: hypothetical protein DWQ47_12555 [Acidobacteriota bacterium]